MRRLRTTTLILGLLLWPALHILGVVPRMAVASTSAWVLSAPVCAPSAELTCGHAYSAPVCAGDTITLHVNLQQSSGATLNAGGCYGPLCSAPVVFTFNGVDYELAASMPAFHHPEFLSWTVGPLTLTQTDIDDFSFHVSCAAVLLANDDQTEVHWASYSQDFVYSAYAPEFQLFQIACADITHDGAVNGDDLSELLAVWNTDAGCDGDLNRDGTVDGLDLGILLGNWSE